MCLLCNQRVEHQDFPVGEGMRVQFLPTSRPFVIGNPGVLTVIGVKPTPEEDREKMGCFTLQVRNLSGQTVSHGDGITWFSSDWFEPV